MLHTDFDLETMQVRRLQQNLWSNQRKKITCQSGILHPAKYLSKMEQNKDISGIQTLKEFITSRHELQEMLKEVLPA